MFAIVDVETTGLSLDVDRVLEVAIIVYDGDRIETEFSSLVYPEQKIASNVTQLTGIRNEDIQDAPKFYEVAKQIVELTEHMILVGHNVRFDYSFLRKEFRRIGYDFRRKQICTLRLSRALIPDLGAYNLNYLRRHLGIDKGSAHRAKEDAQATLKLFQSFQSQHNIYGNLLKEKLRDNILPPAISRAQADRLPEATGIYLFYDDTDQLIYIGKSVNIRQRVLSHFSNDLQSSRSRELKQRIARISFEVTGSELLALLEESHLIKTHQPLFNRAQKRERSQFGLYEWTNDKGYLCLTIAPLDENADGQDPLMTFSGRERGNNYLIKMAKRYGLCYRYCGLESGAGACFQYHLKYCKGACIEEESVQEYNRRVEMSLKQHQYRYPTYLIISEGRVIGEKSGVLIENGQYKGYTYFDESDEEISLEMIRENLEPRLENSDVRRIINAYQKKRGTAQILKFGQ